MKHWLILITLLFGIALAETPKDTLVLQLAGTMNTLDPQQAYDTNVSELATNIYETLVTYEGVTSNLAPMLATEWSISEDALTYTFKLREGVTFHSGNAFSCVDVEYSFRRLLITGNGTSSAFFYSAALLGFAYWDEDLAASTSFVALQTAVSCDAEGQLVLKLAQSDPNFIFKLALHSAGILDSQFAIDNGEWDGTEATWQEWIGKDISDSIFNRQGSGTGAYQLAARESDRVILTAFDGYWGEKGNIKNVILQLVEDDSARVLAMKNGDADIITYDSQSVLKQLEGAEGVTLYALPSLSASGVFLNQAIAEGSTFIGSGQLDGKGIPLEFFSDIHVRRGFAASFDRQRMIDEVYEGQAEDRNAAFPTTFPGYDPALETIPFDLKLAEAEFKQAFEGKLWEQGFVLEAVVGVGDSAGAQGSFDLLKQTLAQLNPKFVLNVQALTLQELYPAILQGFAPATVNGTSAEVPDALGLLTFFYSSSGTFAPHTHLHDEQIDALLAEAATLPDPAERGQRYAQVAARAEEELPVIVLPTSYNIRVYHSALQGFEAAYNPYRYTNLLYKDLSK
jgi:peptide/nickel transport system substrate-binding protein